MSRQRYKSAINRGRWAIPLLARRLAVYNSLPADPTLQTRALAIPFAVAEMETSWGYGWPVGSEMQRSLNLGAIHAGFPPCKARQILHVDKNQNGQEYRVCFWQYSTWEEATDALLNQVYTIRPSVWTAATAGRILGSSLALYLAKYYGGVQGKGNTEGNVSTHLLTIYPAVMAATDLLWHDAPPRVWSADDANSAMIFAQEDSKYGGRQQG
jgi:hypothetical protein